MNRCYKRVDQVEMASISDEAILFHPNNKTFFVLNETGSFLWDRLAEPANPEGLANDLCREFSGVQPGQALSDIERVLQEMLSANIIVAEESEH
jgi:hypothetical protein